MQIAIVYNPKDPKLHPEAYSWTYRDMFMAIQERFAPVIQVTEDCEAAAIEADVILFFDVHSSHHITISGIEKHKAVKVEYFNDPYQTDQQGVYGSSGLKFHKLGAQQRTERALRRGVSHIICPYLDMFHQYIAPHAPGINHLWFPVAPTMRVHSPSPLAVRQAQCLASGHLWAGDNEFKPYEFRRWACSQGCVTHARHSIESHTPKGHLYQPFLARYAAALAACDTHVVPKYLEIPMAGCLCVCQMLPDYANLGFKDGVNCVSVDPKTFDERVRDIIDGPARYQTIADAGRALVVNNYTARHFSEYLHREFEYINAA